MTPYEILLSESQERMLIVLEKGREQEVFDVFSKWDLRAAEVGRVTDDGTWRCTWHGDEVAAIPVPLLTDAAPKYERPMTPAAPPPPLPEVAHPVRYEEVLVHLLASPDVCDKKWIWRQYDHQVGTDTVVGPGLDAALVRVKGTHKHLAFVCDSNGHHVGLDPFVGTAGQVAECARNLACVGATPVGLTDCMNFGNPEKPEIMWQFAQSVDGMAEACRALDVPVVSGNVSLYNETDGKAILPTPGLAMVGLHEGDTPRVRGRFPETGLEVALLGHPGRGHLGGSLYLREVHAIKRAGSPPPVDYAAERALHDALRRLIHGHLVLVAHDCSDGGLLVALAECCLGARNGDEGIGGTFTVPDESAAALFGEDHGRAIVAYAPELRAAVAHACEGVPVTVLGRTGGDKLVVGTKVDLHVRRMQAAWEGTFPSWVG